MNERLISNLDQVRNRIADAASRSMRDPAGIRLVAVTKYVDAETTRALVEAGCRDIGESRPQVLWEKAESLGDLDINWHMIGHLQRNKVKRTVACASLIHSVDSLRLFNAINEAGREANQVVHTLIEVNVSGEGAKHGFAASDLALAWEPIAALDYVSVGGFMCMAGLSGGREEARREFAQLRRLAEDLAPSTPSNVNLSELSMGMSGDFEIAIEEGATIVRIGSVLFEGMD